MSNSSSNSNSNERSATVVAVHQHQHQQQPPPQQQQQQQFPPIVGGNAALEHHYRLTQLYHYAMAAERIRGGPGGPGGGPFGGNQLPGGIRPELAPFLYGPYACRIDPRLAAVGLCRPPEEPKPQHSYIGLIAMAILSHVDKKLVLSDIYQYILDNYPYFRQRGPGWRNSIRHNLSLNDCFVKAGRSANGKGHYWAIHPANIDDFTKGDFRRRKAQRKVRKHMGLAVDDEDSPSPPPVSPPPIWNHQFGLNPAGLHHQHPAFPLLSSLQQQHQQHQPPSADQLSAFFAITSATANNNNSPNGGGGKSDPILHERTHSLLSSNRKRQFDVASLLAPEKIRIDDRITTMDRAMSPSSPASGKSDHLDQVSLSSPSPPPVNVHVRSSKLFKKSRGGQESDESLDEGDEETIEVEVDCKDVKPEVSSTTTPSLPHLPLSSRDRKPSCSSSDEEISPAGFQRFPKSNNNQVNELDHHISRDRDRDRDRRPSPPIMSQNHPQNNPIFDFLGHSAGVGGYPPQFHPHHQFFQQNPSLASLMLLSTRYREITNNLANNNNINHKRSS